MKLSYPMIKELRRQARGNLGGFVMLSPDTRSFDALVRRGLISNGGSLTKEGWRIAIDRKLIDDKDNELAEYLASGFRVRSIFEEEGR